jgi:small subunit ribosomal protein S16
LATKIRLRRMGTNKKPFYRIVVADSRAPRDGRFIEQLGYYDPKITEGLKVEKEKAKRWLGVGAQPSETVVTLLRRAGVLSAPQGPGKAAAEEPKKKAAVKKEAAAEADQEVPEGKEKPSEKPKAAPPKRKPAAKTDAKLASTTGKPKPKATDKK